jgi:hypothetical protein
MKKSELIHGAYYNGNCRNASVARWDANRNLFVHWRTKFGERFLETILHPEDDDRHDVFEVESILENPEEVIPLDVEEEVKSYTEYKKRVNERYPRKLGSTITEDEILGLWKG